MAAAFISLTKVIVFVIVAASAIVSLYSAVNAMAIYTDVNVFFSGLAIVFFGVFVGPLFSFIAGYGFVYYLDRPVGHAILFTAPALIAWSIVAVRILAGIVRR